MTLDAQDWVWQHSRTRGNARLVMLAIADAITGPDALASMGTAEIMQRLNVSRSTARAAVDAALASDELVEDEPAKGSRATRYKIPGAVGYVRQYRGTGPKSGPVTPQAPGPNSGPLPATGPNSGPPTGPKSGPPAQGPDILFGAEIGPPMGPESGPHHSPIDGVNEGGREEYRAEVATIPAKARPLVDQITAAGVLVAWTLAPGEWIVVDALMKRSGADMLAQAAVQAAARARGKGVAHARYFLRTWQALPPAPEPGTVPATAPAGPARSNVVPFPSAAADRPGRAAQAAGWYADLLAEEN
ncbi:DNA binding protein [Streptomyces phage Picard]|uniref:DNA binding protein n=1 Tax=Streptomyces phage Picard TaxID=1920311 RepID=A0A1J0MC24_9CAUD|nr:replication initiation protein [Streptomyces phage Picard]APD18571.1 DNA binding protein [Streptomyces phage Picard]